MSDEKIEAQRRRVRAEVRNDDATCPLCRKPWSKHTKKELAECESEFNDGRKDAAYKGYLITKSLTGNEYFISKGGQHIYTASSTAQAEKEIDALTRSDAASTSRYDGKLCRHAGCTNERERGTIECKAHIEERKKAKEDRKDAGSFVRWKSGQEVDLTIAKIKIRAGEWEAMNDLPEKGSRPKHVEFRDPESGKRITLLVEP